MNSNTHIFFCSEMDCSNISVHSDTTCNDCYEAKFTREQAEGCPGCGVLGATMALNNGYCGSCWQQRYGCESPIADSCTCGENGVACDHCQEYLNDKDEQAVWCDTKPHWCGECEQCQSEYYEQCGGCGTNCNLWDSRYCKSCYDVRYVKPLPPSPEPEQRSLSDVYDEIAHIKEKLLTKMTPRQTADWQWLLGRREDEIKEYLEQMWAGYDKDDLRKLDLMGRRMYG